MEASPKNLTWAAVVPKALDAIELVCATHGAYMARGARLASGKEVRDPCPECKAAEDEAAAALERAGRQARRLERVRQRMEGCGLPARFAGRTFDGYRVKTPGQAAALKACREFVENFDANAKRGAVLVLAGLPGTGKTHLAAAMLRELAASAPGLYIGVADLFRAVRDTWRRDSERSESQLLAELSRVPLLVLDEVGVQYGTDGEQNILFSVLDRRYRDMRPCVLITNESREGLTKAIGERLADRLRETARLVPFDWESYRPEARREALAGGAS